MGKTRFNDTDKNSLKDRVGNLCSNPSCKTPTCLPHSEGNKAIRTGDAAHIYSASPVGPRAVVVNGSHVDEGALHEIENGIWLCVECHRLVDADPWAYPAVLLREWKLRAEDECTMRHRAMRLELQQPVPSSAPQPQQFITNADWHCGHCYWPGNSGQRVCSGPGCGAEVAYAPTSKEVGDAIKAFAMFAFFVVLVALARIPELLNENLGMTVPDAFGWHPAVFYVSAGFIFVSVFLGLKFKFRDNRYWEPRFFRDFHHT